jgi:hypothetical protein
MTDPILYNILDKAYNGVMQNMPQALQDSDMASAFILGSAGSYVAIRATQWLSKIFPNFEEKCLPTLEKICMVGLGFAPLIYAAADPQGAKEIMTQHPAYTSGLMGAWVGCMSGAAQDLYKRKKKKSLDSLVN